VWAGIPSSSLTRGAAERFLSWFFQPEVQKKLILQGRLEDDRSFGLAGGLSAQVAANVDAVPAVFPELSGRIPLQDQVAFWGPLPANWPLLKSSVLGPWLETSTADEALLRSLLDKHRSQAVRD
jgi:ABC-type glycerol-3-phosphate transport system substrate-binding protein